jgi:hypothetical protein
MLSHVQLLFKEVSNYIFWVKAPCSLMRINWCFPLLPASWRCLAWLILWSWGFWWPIPLTFQLIINLLPKEISQKTEPFTITAVRLSVPHLRSYQKFMQRRGDSLIFTLQITKFHTFLMTCEKQAYFWPHHICWIQIYQSEHYNIHSPSLFHPLFACKTYKCTCYLLFNWQREMTSNVKKVIFFITVDKNYNITRREYECEKTALFALYLQYQMSGILYSCVEM